MLRSATYLAAFCLLAAAALAAGEASTDDVVPEENFLVEELRDPAPELVEEFIASKKKKLTGSAKQTLKHITDLRAFCVAANGRIEDFQDVTTNADSGLLTFLKAFGHVSYKTPPPTPPPPSLPDNVPNLPVTLPNGANLAPVSKKKMAGNIVLQYAHAMAKMHHFFKEGFGPYMTGNLDKMVLAGGKGDPLEVYDGVKGQMVTVNHKVLGLSKRPAYLDTIAVTLTEYQSWLAKIHKLALSADAAAAAEWLRSGGNDEYISFFNKEVEKANGITKKSNARVLSAALHSIETWYRDRGTMKKLIHAFSDGRKGPVGMMPLKDLPAKGLEGANSAKTIAVPTEVAMEKAAHLAAKNWMKGQSGNLAVKEVNKLDGNAKKPAAKPVKKACHVASLKGYQSFAWDGKYCYKIEFGKVVQQDTNSNAAKCAKGQFNSNYIIGKYTGDAHLYTQGSYCGVVKKDRQVTVSVTQDPSVKQTTAQVSEPHTCNYQMHIIQKSC